MKTVTRKADIGVINESKFNIKQRLIKVLHHYYEPLKPDAKFYSERTELINWLNGKQDTELILHCNNARIKQDLFHYLTGKNYSNLTIEEKNKALNDANLICYMGSSNHIVKFCEINNFPLRKLTRGVKDKNGNYYPYFILYNSVKFGYSNKTNVTS